MKPGNVWQLFDFPVSVGFALNPSLASTTFKKIESFRKPESRKQLLMRILGGKKGSKVDGKVDGKVDAKEEEESNSTPELQSSQSDPLAGNLVEPDDKDGSGFEETPDLEDEHEQENEESIRSEQAVPSTLTSSPLASTSKSPSWGNALTWWTMKKKRMDRSLNQALRLLSALALL